VDRPYEVEKIKEVPPQRTVPQMAHSLSLCTPVPRAAQRAHPACAPRARPYAVCFACTVSVCQPSALALPYE